MDIVMSKHIMAKNFEIGIDSYRVAIVENIGGSILPNILVGKILADVYSNKFF